MLLMLEKKSSRKKLNVATLKYFSSLLLKVVVRPMTSADQGVIH